MSSNKIHRRNISFLDPSMFVTRCAQCGKHEFIEYPGFNWSGMVIGFLDGQEVSKFLHLCLSKQ